MRFLSVCSGIEAASVAWQPLGWQAVAFSEIEPFPCAVLAHHYPDTPNYGDMTKFKDWPDHAIDLLCGGTPCQSFSVAGLRKGLDDPRGNLMLTFGAIAARYRPKWLVWENVPGVLSSNGGRDFGSFLGLLGVLGYGFAYRIFDAQYAGLAQRRKRVFVVGCLGDWRSAAAVLFERHSLQGHPAPRRETGKAAPTIPSRSTAGGGLGTDFDCDGGLIHQPVELLCVATGQAGADLGADLGADMAPTLNCNHEAPYIAGTLLGGGHTNNPLDETLIAHSLRGEGFDASEDGTVRGTPLVPVIAPCLTANYGKQPDNSNSSAGPMLVPVAFSCKDYGNDATGDLAPTMRSMGHDASHANGGGQLAVAFPARMSGTQCASAEDVSPSLGALNPTAVAFAQNQRDEVRTMDVAGALAAEPAAKQQTYARIGMQVRRLTPRECERLQGFSDDYLDIAYRNKPAADGPKYKALGNSWATPCARWIGERIEAVEAITAQQREAA